MESTNELTPEQLYDQALAHYRAARWSEALAVINELLALGYSSAEIDTLLQDIKFKQRLDLAQAPVASAPPPERRIKQGALLGMAGATVAIALLGVAISMSFRGDRAAAQPPLAQDVVGALPTLAPTGPAAEVAPAGGIGTLAIDLAEEETLALGVENVYLILDASGSMLARVGERRKIDIAQEALAGLVDRLPTNSNVALRTYGRQRADDCSDVELLAPLAPIDREGLITLIEAVEPVNLSRTPIGDSLSAVPEDLGQDGGETLVVLLSDGEETCDADPAAIAANLHAERPNVRVSVVGFDIAPELRDRLAAIAVAGGGTYYDAGDVAQLATALEEVVTARFRVLDPAGVEVGAGLVGEELMLPAGPYTVTVGIDPVLFEQPVQVWDSMATLVAIRDDEGRLSAEVRRDWQR